MFYLSQDQIKDLIDSRKPIAYLIPLYVVVDNKKYGILQFDEIKNLTRNSFKVGFGTSKNYLIKTPKSFNFSDLLLYFDNVEQFTRFNEVTNTNTTYIMFETSIIDCEDILSQKEEYSDLLAEISFHDELLFTTISQLVREKRRKILSSISEENV